MLKKLAKHQLYVVIGLMALAVVFVSAVGTVLWLKQTDTADTPTSTTQLSPEEAEQKRLGEEVEDVRAQELRTLITSEADKQKKAEYLIELSLIAYNRGSYEAALPAAKEAESLIKSASTAVLLGDIYFAQKDYDQAARQYGVAMDRSDKSETGSRSAYNEYAILKKKAEDAQ